MTIKFRGYLKNNNQLKSVDESRLEKMAIGWIDYLFVFLIILYPLTKSLKLLNFKCIFNRYIGFYYCNFINDCP